GPLSRLRAPAIDRVLEIADDGEADRRDAQRRPVERGERPAREPAELSRIARAATGPAAREKGREPVQHRAARARQDDEPEYDPEDMPVRGDESLLDGEPHDRLAAELITAMSAPQRQHLARLGQVVLLQREMDLGE